jgi:hypothetical protein
MVIWYDMVGWGDRLLGASAAKCVQTYIGFDPNKALRPVRNG